jgi:predicted DNA-binding transcriptional regulator AlpA
MKLYTYVEIAAAARISISSLQRRIKDGTGPRVHRIGHRVLCNQADLDDWLSR